MLKLVHPMLAVTARLPGDEAAWCAEFKWDGLRCVAYVRDDGLRLLSRNDRDITGGYPELAGLAGGRRAVLDGEIVATGPDGRPDFGALQARMHVRHPQPDLVRAVPVAYYAFDVLHLDGRDTLALPYARRRELLETLELPQVSPAYPGQASAVLAAARARGLEGVICKRLDSPYLPGRRSDLWRKTKLTHTVDVIVGGWKPGEGRRSGLPGSLLVGVPGPDGLRYAGHVGTGFTDAALRELAVRLAPLERDSSPFAGPQPPGPARWVEPVLAGEVEFAQWTREGLLRHPSWRGMRE
ncbi:non-homologous end-joining DNA ligase [Nonomuraea sp. NPDC050663]|uniref:non-homologous end-joining DNA ligase n=1 Tax=Nonomuraea sp. NPDC050663 TaxID=3364370 RepID=UPI00379D3697